MPSALRSGLISVTRNCERKATKPPAAPTNKSANAPTVTARQRLTRLRITKIVTDDGSKHDGA